MLEGTRWLWLWLCRSACHPDLRSPPISNLRIFRLTHPFFLLYANTRVAYSAIYRVLQTGWHSLARSCSAPKRRRVGAMAASSANASGLRQQHQDCIHRAIRGRPPRRRRWCVGVETAHTARHLAPTNVVSLLSLAQDGTVSLLGLNGNDINDSGSALPRRISQRPVRCSWLISAIHSSSESSASQRSVNQVESSSPLNPKTCHSI